MTGSRMQNRRSDAVVDFARLFLTDLSPDLTGEMLRELTFVGEGTGCYSTFDVRDDAVKWERGSRRLYWLDIEAVPGDDLDEQDEYLDEIVDMGEGYTYMLGPKVQVRVCWYWDGDGTLSFTVKGPDFERTLINHDCKKDYCWEEVRRRVRA